jgi:hypothetical protein
MLLCCDWLCDLFKTSVELGRCGRSLLTFQIISDDQFLCHNILAPRKRGWFLNRHKIHASDFLAHIKFHFIHKNSGNFKGNYVNVKKQVNQSPLQAWSGPQGARKLRFPDFMTTAQVGGKVVSLTHTGRLYPQKILLVLISVRG